MVLSSVSSSVTHIGRVVIHGLYTNETTDFSYRSPILSVALDPNYARSKKRSFVCGGRAGNLVLNVKGIDRSCRRWRVGWVLTRARAVGQASSDHQTMSSMRARVPSMPSRGEDH